MKNSSFSLASFSAVRGRWAVACLCAYWIIMVTLFIAAWMIRSSLPSLPLMDPDTHTYLSPSAHLFTTGKFILTFRSFLYPSFLSLILWAFPYLDAISYIQHIFGMATAALIVLIFFRSRVFLPAGQFLDWMTRLIALLSAYLFLFTRSPITLEHSIRPEALFPTACALTILVGLEFSRRALLEKHIDLLSSVWGVLLIVFAIGTYYLKPAWGLATGTSLLPLLLAWILIPRHWLWKLSMPFIGATLALIFFFLPGKLLPRDEETSFLAETLFCTHAEFLSDIIQRDALQLPPESKEQVYLLKFVQDIHSAISSPSRDRYGLSLNPDDLMYRGPLGILKNRLKSSGISPNRFFYYYYFRTWVEHPLGMLKKILLQLEFFFTPRKVHIYQIGTDIFLQERYDRIPKMLDHVQYPPWQPINEYRTCLEAQKLAQKEFPVLPYKLQWLVLLFNNTFLILLILSIAGIGFIFWKNRDYTHLIPAALCALYLASFNISNCLTIAIVHMMAVDRYYFNQITMSLVSQGFEVLFLIALLQAYLERRKNNQLVFQQSIKIPSSSSVKKEEVLEPVQK